MHSHSFRLLGLFALFFLPFTGAVSFVFRSLDTAPVLHFTLTRRGGKFAPQEYGRDSVNLSSLAQELEKTEARFNLTQRQVAGNKLVRKAKSVPAGGKDEGTLMGEVAKDGVWYAALVWMIEETASLTLLGASGMPSSISAARLRKLRWTSICSSRTSML